MEDELRTPPAALDSPDDGQQTPPSAETPAAPEDQGGESTPAAGSKQQRDLLAQRGRELKTAQARAQAAETRSVQLSETVGDLTTRLQALEGHVNAQRQADMEAELAQLPPDERAERRIEILEQRLEALSRPAPVNGVQYYRQRSVQLLGMANTHYGLSGDQAITMNDLPESAKQNEAAFTAALEIMGQARSGGVGARGIESEDGMPKKDETPTEMAARIKQEVLSELGSGRSNASRPAAATKTSAPDEGEFIDTTFGYNSKKGPGAMRAALQAQKDRALDAVNARK